MDNKEELAKQAVNEHYQCNGKYPCSERAYCRFCNGKNNAHNCNEDCYADEFNEGFYAGWDAAVNYLANLPFDKMLKHFECVLNNKPFDAIIEENKDILKRLKDK